MTTALPTDIQTKLDAYIEAKRHWLSPEVYEDAPRRHEAHDGVLRVGTQLVDAIEAWTTEQARS